MESTQQSQFHPINSLLAACTPYSSNKSQTQTSVQTSESSIKQEQDITGFTTNEIDYDLPVINSNCHLPNFCSTFEQSNVDEQFIAGQDLVKLMSNDMAFLSSKMENISSMEMPVLTAGECAKHLNEASGKIAVRPRVTRSRTSTRANTLQKGTLLTSGTEKRIPRPPNAFMIFGQQNRKLLATQYPQYTNKQISKILGDEWRKMNEQDKSYFHKLSEEAHAKHMQKYPGYYYSPLEARQRKADRKKKFFQKISSRRTSTGCCSTTSPTDLEPIASASSNESCNSTLVSPNELPIQCESFFTPATCSVHSNNNTVSYSTSMNVNCPSTYSNTLYQPNTCIVSASRRQHIPTNSCIMSLRAPCPSAQTIIRGQAPSGSHSYETLPPLSNFYPSMSQPPNFTASQANQSVNQRSFLMCSRSANGPCLVYQPLLQTSEISNNSQMHFAHHHPYSAWSNPAIMPVSMPPTIYHVTSKDPNLNSTLTSGEHSPATMSIISTQSSASNYVNISPQSNDITSLSVFLPPMDNPTSLVTPVNCSLTFEDVMEELQQSQTSIHQSNDLSNAAEEPMFSNAL